MFSKPLFLYILRDKKPVKYEQHKPYYVAIHFQINHFCCSLSLLQPQGTLPLMTYIYIHTLRVSYADLDLVSGHEIYYDIYLMQAEQTVYKSNQNKHRNVIDQLSHTM